MVYIVLTNGQQRTKVVIEPSTSFRAMIGHWPLGSSFFHVLEPKCCGFITVITQFQNSDENVLESYWTVSDLDISISLNRKYKQQLARELLMRSVRLISTNWLLPKGFWQMTHMGSDLEKTSRSLKFLKRKSPMIEREKQLRMVNYSSDSFCVVSLPYVT